TLLSRQLAFAQEPIAGVCALCIFPSPVSVHRQLVEQSVFVDPVLYGRRIIRISDGQALRSELISSFVEALVAAEASGSVQGLGAGRACSGCLHVGGDDFIVGTAKFLFLPSGTEEHQESVRFRWQRRYGFPLLIHTRYFSVKRMASRLFFPGLG